MKYFLFPIYYLRFKSALKKLTKDEIEKLKIELPEVLKEAKQRNTQGRAAFLCNAAYPEFYNTSLLFLTSIFKYEPMGYVTYIKYKANDIKAREKFINLTLEYLDKLSKPI